jgi:hypothetical protein
VLRQKQFYVVRNEPAELAEGPKLLPRLLTLFSAMIPLVRFLNVPLKDLTVPTSESAFGRTSTW